MNTLGHIVGLSLAVSLSAVLLASLIGLPLGAAIAVGALPRARRALIVLLNALMGLPPVVVGLVVYLLLSRAGPLGELGLLFTPPAMVDRADHPGRCRSSPRSAASRSRTPGSSTRSSCARWAPARLRAALTLVWDIRFSLVTAVLAGLRPGARRGRRGDDRRRQHRRRHARDDHHHRAGDLARATCRWRCRSASS